MDRNSRVVRWVGLATVLLLAAFLWLPGPDAVPDAEEASGGVPADALSPNPASVRAPSHSPAPILQVPSQDPLDLVIPVAGIEPDELVDTFADARSAGRVHNAIDIMAPRGTPVLAAADGYILRLHTSDNGGLTVYQRAPGGETVYYYAHLDRYEEGLTADQPVRQGEVIGYVGDTGNAVPGNYHLHFAVWTVDDPESFWDGDPVNPYPLLADEG